MNNEDYNKFYELGYTHTELEALLKKISGGELLTKEQYDVLTTAVGLITNLKCPDETKELLKKLQDDFCIFISRMFCIMQCCIIRTSNSRT